jgi:hypothetical protein
MTRLTRAAALSAALAFAALPIPFFAASAGETVPAKSTITGVLTAADDAGYPMYWIGITPAGGTESRFMLNNEEAEVVGQIGEMVGKTVTADYEVRPTIGVLDLVAGGKSITFPDGQKPDPVPEAKTITGTLSGAAEPTGGDLPSELAVTAKDGAKVVFEWFVDDTMVKYDGKEVTLTYVAETTDTVTRIALTP